MLLFEHKKDLQDYKKLKVHYEGSSF